MGTAWFVARLSTSSSMLLRALAGRPCVRADGNDGHAQGPTGQSEGPPDTCAGSESELSRGGISGENRRPPRAVTGTPDLDPSGTAPQSIMAARIENGKTIRTRPLCPYPQVAAYSGSGSIDEASNFVCQQVK
jgi:hypothetical protein